MSPMTDFTHFSGVSIDDFEQFNAGWVNFHGEILFPVSYILERL